MRAPQAFTDPAAGDVASAVLAILRPSFPQTLLNALRRVANVGHCMVFIFEGDRSARRILDIGNIAIGPDLGVAYSEHFHFADPNREAVFRKRTNATPIVLPTFARHMYSERYLKIFFKDADIRRQIRNRHLGRRYLLLREFLPNHSAGSLQPRADRAT